MLTPSGTTRNRATLRSITTAAALSIGACSGPSDPAHYEELGPDQATLNVLREKQAKLSEGLRVIWFGHSLLEVRSGVPIHIPELVLELRALAAAAGRTPAAPGTSRMHYEGPQHLGYWFEGAGRAADKMRKDDPGWDFVVGVGFMHLVSEGRRLAWLYNPIRALAGSRRDSFKTYAAYTGSKYRAIRAVREHGRGAVWVNYVAPRLSDHPEEQPFVDERFECIRETAAKAGIPVINVPVGRAFRLAERRLAERSDLKASLQVADRLHLTRAGEYLAANVFLAQLYGVDPVGLALPGRSASLTDDSGDSQAVALLLQEAARDTVQAYLRGQRVRCRPEAMLHEDSEGLALLRAAKTSP
jgi:hypothetical protein